MYITYIPLGTYISLLEISIYGARKWEANLAFSEKI